MNENNKREYNSERRRKPILNINDRYLRSKNIRENITPRGDGNILNFIPFTSAGLIRENITPRGDGNEACKEFISDFLIK